MKSFQGCYCHPIEVHCAESHLRSVMCGLIVKYWETNRWLDLEQIEPGWITNYTTWRPYSECPRFNVHARKKPPTHKYIALINVFERSASVKWSEAISLFPWGLLRSLQFILGSERWPRLDKVTPQHRGLLLLYPVRNSQSTVCTDRSQHNHELRLLNKGKRGWAVTNLADLS